MRLKLIRWLFIPFAAVLLMSHNSYAVQASIDVSISYTNFNSSMYFCVEQVNTGEQVSGQCGNRYWASATGEFAYNANIHTSASGIKFFTPTGYQMKYNDIIQLEFDVVQASANNSLDTEMISFRSNTSGFQVIDISYDQLDNTTSHVKVLLWASRAEGYSSGALPVILIPSRVPTNEANNYTWNFIWLRENGASVLGGLVNVFHIKSSGGTTFDDTDILNNIDDVKESIEQQTEQEQQAADNIAGQTPSGMAESGGSGENATTSSLLSTLGSFLTAITNLQATNCNVQLDFPQFAGGSQTVNICQNKEYTGNIVSIAGSVILVMFYLPVAFMLVSKIYSEIRSFTNG